MAIAEALEQELNEIEEIAILSGVIENLKPWLREIQFPALVQDGNISVPYADCKIDFTIEFDTDLYNCDWILGIKAIIGMGNLRENGRWLAWGLTQDERWFVVEIESHCYHSLEQTNRAKKIHFAWTDLDTLIHRYRCKPRSIIAEIRKACENTRAEMASNLAKFTAATDQIANLVDQCEERYPKPHTLIRSVSCRVLVKGIDRKNLLANIANQKVRILGITENKKLFKLKVFLVENEDICNTCGTIHTGKCPTCASRAAQKK
ncbi:MAG: hypothetical protein WCI57_05015 [Candidatus Berkelbacteria bacterium]